MDYAGPAAILTPTERLQMLAADVMTEDPLWVDARTTTGEAVRKLLESRVRHLPVLDNGVVIGMLSDRDLRSGTSSVLDATHWPGELSKYLSEPVESLMSRPVQSVAPNSDLKDAITLMLREHVGAIPVVDPESNHLVGIISYLDVLQAVGDLLWGT
jgi:acetoin utilization protein AcuB